MKTEYHKTAVFNASNLVSKIETPEKTLPVVVNKDAKEKFDAYIKILENIAEVVHLCGKQCIALRGNNENLNSESSGNCGNFLAIVKLLGKHVPEIEKHLETANKISYLSGKTQNEMIQVIGLSMIQADLINEIKEAGFHSVMCDEVTNEEILSICFRFVDKEKNIRKEFLDFVGVNRINGRAIANAILEFYKSHGLDVKLLRGQSYDGAANMSSERVGVSALIKEESPNAFYTHCHSHRLNLAICAACKNNHVQNTLETMKAINLFFFMSPKRAKILEAIIEKANLHPSKRSILLGLCKTRWSERDVAYEHSYLSLPFVIETLEVLSGTHSNMEKFDDELNEDKHSSKNKQEAMALLKAVTSFDYIVGVVSLYYLMHPLKGVTQKLQGRTIDVIAAFQEIEDVKSEIKNLRENIEKEFSKIYNQSVRVAETVDVTIEKPRTVQRQKNRDNQPSDSIEEYFRRSLAVPLLDNLIMELETRFDSKSKEFIKLLHLIPSICAKDDNDDDLIKIQEVVDLYEDDIPNPLLVEVEFGIWKRKWKKVSEEKRPESLASSIKEMDETTFPNLFILMKIACTLPVTSCECERSFSCMRRLHTWLRSSMGMQRLSSLALMSIHYDYKIDYSAAARKFVELHPRRITEPTLFFAD